MLDALVRNWPLKLLALALALAMWLAVTSEAPIVQEFTVPLEIALAEGHTLAGSAPTGATVRLRGPESLLRRVNHLELAVDLTGTTPGERTVQLGPGNLVGVPRGLEVAFILPDRVTLEVDWKIRRDLPVRPSLVGEPPEGYVLYRATVSPGSLGVEGPRSVVDRLTSVGTDPVQLEGRTTPFNVRVGAVPQSPGLRILDSGLLEVRVEVDESPVEQVFGPVPIALEGQEHATTVSPEALDVVLSGPPALLGRIELRQLRAVVDVTGVAPRTKPYHLPPRIEFVDVPDSSLARISVKSSNRETVEVSVSDREGAG